MTEERTPPSGASTEPPLARGQQGEPIAVGMTLVGHGFVTGVTWPLGTCLSCGCLVNVETDEGHRPEKHAASVTPPSVVTARAGAASTEPHRPPDEIEAERLSHCHRCGACVCAWHTALSDDTLDTARRICERCAGAAYTEPPRTEAGRNFLARAGLLIYEEDIEASDRIMAAVAAIEAEARAGAASTEATPPGLPESPDGRLAKPWSHDEAEAYNMGYRHGREHAEIAAVTRASTEATPPLRCVRCGYAMTDPAQERKCSRSNYSLWCSPRASTEATERPDLRAALDYAVGLLNEVRNSGVIFPRSQWAISQAIAAFLDGDEWRAALAGASSSEPSRERPIDAIYRAEERLVDGAAPEGEREP